jgi:hypothetical protein
MGRVIRRGAGSRAPPTDRSDAIVRNRAVRSLDRIRAVSFSRNRHFSFNSPRNRIASFSFQCDSRDELARNGDEAKKKKRGFARFAQNPRFFRLSIRSRRASSDRALRGDPPPSRPLRSLFQTRFDFTPSARSGQWDPRTRAEIGALSRRNGHVQTSLSREMAL